MKWILPLVALLCMSAGANSDVLHSAKLNFIQGKKAYNQKNYVYAKRLYRRACDKGLSDVCNTLAFMYLDGTIDSNTPEMLTVLKKGCEGDNALSCMLLATHTTQESDAKAKGCKLLESSKPYWKAQESMEKWNCFNTVEPEESMAESKQVKNVDTKPVNNYTLKFKNKCGDSIGIAYKVKKKNGVEVSYSLHKMNPDEIYSIPNIVENEIYYFAKAIYKNNVWGGKYTNRLGNGERYGFGKIKMNLTGYTGTHILDITCPNNNQKKYKIINVASNDTLNVRSDAGTQNRKIDELAHNARGVKVLHCKKAPDGRKWCKVKQYSISTGWVSAWYLKLQ